MKLRGKASMLAWLLPALAVLAACGGGGDLKDEDGDGWLPPADCNDRDSNIHPGAREIPYNTVDEDCDGIANNDTDFDGHDAAQSGGDDCDDGDPHIHPGAPEIPYDGVDQNCNGMGDEYDIDGDGHKAKMFGGDDCCDSGLELSLGCAGATAASIKPGASEIIGNGIDENCDGSDTEPTVIEGDADGDGFAADTRPEGLDCDDTDSAVYPGAPEVCDGKDNDCDGWIDETAVDLDDDDATACFDCDDYDGRRSPAYEEIPYNDIDENCDGVAVNDVDGDGYWPVIDPNNPDRPLDCNDGDAAIHPGAAEKCNHKDDNCDGQIDEDFAATYTDADGDTWLGGGDGQCPDCDDNDAGTNPAAFDSVDGKDNNCNGWTDEIDADGDTYFSVASVGPGPFDCCDNGSETQIPGCSPATATQIHPGAQDLPNNGMDEDCNGEDLVVEDMDGDGHRAKWAGGDDCDDSNADAYPGHAEVCSDPADNDCSGLINEDCGPGTGEEVQVQAGHFTMGSDRAYWSDQRPQHVVEISAFAIDKYEVTVADYRRCVAAGVCMPPIEIFSEKDERYFENQQKGLYPAIWIHQDQARRYCEWTGKRLPTEAEWEKAARGGGSTTWAYPWGDIEYTTSPDGTRVRKPLQCDKANHTHLWTGKPCEGDPARVDAYPLGASVYGALNMAGNVAEWVADWYDENYYRVSPNSNPTGPASGIYKVFRGGSFRSVDYLVEVTYRGYLRYTDTQLEMGFRCARSLP